MGRVRVDARSGCHGTGFGGSIPAVAAQPFPGLVGHFGLQLTAAQPVVQELAAARVGQAEEVVFGGAHHGRAAGERGVRVDEVGGGVDLAAHFAGITVLVLCVAVGAFALDVAVRQEHFLHRVEELLDGAGADQSGGLEAAVDAL